MYRGLITTGLKFTLTTFNSISAASKTLQVGGDFIWDGQDQDKRPLSNDEMLEGIAVTRKRRGRPARSSTKEQVAIRLDHDVLAAFRTDALGCNTRMNEALKDWLRKHSAV